MWASNPLLALLALALQATSIWAYDFTGFNSLELSSGEMPNFTFYFKQDGQVATLAVEVAVTGDKWFGVGVTSSGGMIGADLAVFLPTADGSTYTVGDYWSLGFSQPKLDASQDLNLLETAIDIDSGLTTVVWSRHLDSCDQEEDLDLLSFRQIIFAVGRTATLSYHQFRGNGVVDWVRGDITSQFEAEVEQDVIVKSMIPPVKIPLLSNNKTQYHCVSMPLSLDVDHHVVKMQFEIDTKYAHHMLFFTCEHDQVMYQDQEVVPNMPFHCGIMPPSGCNGVGAWAVGVKNSYMEPQFGIRIGKSTKHFFIQYHFDNFEYKKDVFDQTGVRLFLTPTLRPEDLATFLVGVPAQTAAGSSIKNIEIPPGEQAFELVSEMPSSCSEKMAHPNITITGVTFHMHQKGTHIYLEHWRNGERLNDLAWQHWDFNFQTGQAFSPDKWVEFRRGDALRLHCIYDTTDTTDVTFGGDGSHDEMCLAFVSVFPPPDIQASFQIDKNLARFGMTNKTLCFSGAGTASGLNPLPDTDSGGITMMSLLQMLVPKSIPETVTSRSSNAREHCGSSTSPSSSSSSSSGGVKDGPESPGYTDSSSCRDSVCVWSNILPGMLLMVIMAVQA